MHTNRSEDSEHSSEETNGNQSDGGLLDLVASSIPKSESDKVAMPPPPAPPSPLIGGRLARSAGDLTLVCVCVCVCVSGVCRVCRVCRVSGMRVHHGLFLLLNLL